MHAAAEEHLTQNGPLCLGRSRAPYVAFAGGIVVIGGWGAHILTLSFVRCSCNTDAKHARVLACRSMILLTSEALNGNEETSEGAITSSRRTSIPPTAREIERQNAPPWQRCCKYW